MAILKSITNEQGITTEYHRIVSVNSIVNICTIIEVCSYINKDKRAEEKEKIANKQPMNIYNESDYINIAYDETMNVSKSYEYLKTIEKFKDGIDG